MHPGFSVVSKNRWLLRSDSPKYNTIEGRKYCQITDIIWEEKWVVVCVLVDSQTFLNSLVDSHMHKWGMVWSLPQLWMNTGQYIGVNSAEISSVCLDISRQTLEISTLFTPDRYIDQCWFITAVKTIHPSFVHNLIADNYKNMTKTCLPKIWKEWTNSNLHSGCIITHPLVVPSSGPARGFEYTVSRVFYTKVFSISLPKFSGIGYSILQ